MSSRRLAISLTLLLLAATACAPSAPGTAMTGTLAAPQTAAVATTLPPTVSPPAPDTGGQGATPSAGATTPAPVTPSYVKCMPGLVALPTTTPPPADTPSFSHSIYFSQTPDPSQAGYQFYQYPPGIKAMYAIWTYANMATGLQVRWDLNLYGTRLQSAEMSWDFAQCGPNGTIIELVASDPQNGLSAGVYELELYIDDQPQFIAQDDPAYRGFELMPPGT